MRPKVFLTIAGSDPSCGAGIQADIRVATKLNHYPLSVVTCITAQNSIGVDAIVSLGSDLIYKQLNSILIDYSPDAVKIGLLPDKKAIPIISSFLKEYKVKNIVLDPIISPTLQDKVPDKGLIEALTEYLFPISTLITPNHKEYLQIEEIIGKPFNALCDNYLIKDGDSSSEIIEDILFLKDSEHNEKFIHKRIDSQNTHGTGCILSSAIACYLSENLSIQKAVASAIEFVSLNLEKSSSLKISNGDYGPALI